MLAIGAPLLQEKTGDSRSNTQAKKDYEFVDGDEDGKCVIYDSALWVTDVDEELFASAPSDPDVEKVETTVITWTAGKSPVGS